MSNASDKKIVNKEIIDATRCWISSVVVELNLCPFARRVLTKDEIRFAVTPAQTEEELLLAVQDELRHLFGNEETATTVLIHPSVLQDFLDYNQFLDYVDQLLESMSLDGVFQVASFHPDYQFGGTEVDDAENYSNRSPYPMLHILREQSVSEALESYPDPDQIPEKNIALLKELGAEQMRARLAACTNGSV